MRLKFEPGMYVDKQRVKSTIVIDVSMIIGSFSQTPWVAPGGGTQYIKVQSLMLRN